MYFLGHFNEFRLEVFTMGTPAQYKMHVNKRVSRQKFTTNIKTVVAYHGA